MDGWSPIVGTASDNDRSSSEGEYTVESGPQNETERKGEQRSNMERMDGGTTVGFGISEIGEGNVILGRTGHAAEEELRYLHLLWEPSRAEPGAAVASKIGKMTGSRARRHGRTIRNVGPIGKDIYGDQ